MSETFPALHDDHLQPISPESLRPAFSTHKPRILILYGSLREVSYSRLLAFEVRRLLERLGCEVRIFDRPDCRSRTRRLSPPQGSGTPRPLSMVGRPGVDQPGTPRCHDRDYEGPDRLDSAFGRLRPPHPGKILAVMEVSGGSQSFNAVNQLRILGRWMRMITIPNQSSVAKAFQNSTLMAE